MASMGHGQSPRDLPSKHPEERDGSGHVDALHGQRTGPAVYDTASSGPAATSMHTVYATPYSHAQDSVPNSGEQDMAHQDHGSLSTTRPGFQSQRPAENGTGQLPNVRSSNKYAAPTVVDHQALLLALADKYLNAAYTSSATIISHNDAASLNYYHTYLTAAINCLESALHNCRMSDPRVDARLRLRLAGILHRETIDHARVQALLVQGILKCQQHQFSDMLYAMQHLLIRSLAVTNPRAALKKLESVIPAPDAYRHLHWSYAFRLLRIEMVSAGDDAKNYKAVLQAISDLAGIAEREGETNVCAFAYLSEAMIQLRIASGDSLSEARKKVAMAKSRMGDDPTRSPIQLAAQANMLDLACELMVPCARDAAPKVKVMQEMMDRSIKASNWRANGAFELSLSDPISADAVSDCDGVFSVDDQGNSCLALNWLTRTELFAVGYLLSGIATLQKSGVDAKASQYLQAGLKLTGPLITAETIDKRPLDTVRSSKMQSIALHCSLSLYEALAQCNWSRWDQAQQVLHRLETHGTVIDSNSMRTMLTYLHAATRQGQGDTEGALSLYSSPDLSLSTATAKISAHERNLRFLSTLHQILILSADETTRAEAATLFNVISERCRSHSDKAVHAISYILQVTALSRPLYSIKSDLQNAISISKALQNQQLLTLVLNLIDVLLYTGIVGSQAEQAAHASAKLSEQAHSPLWAAVSYAKWAGCMERHGRTAEAQDKMERARMYMEGLCPSLKRKFVDVA